MSRALAGKKPYVFSAGGLMKNASPNIWFLMLSSSLTFKLSKVLVSFPVLSWIVKGENFGKKMKKKMIKNTSSRDSKQEWLKMGLIHCWTFVQWDDYGINWLQNIKFVKYHAECRNNWYKLKRWHFNGNLWLHYEHELICDAKRHSVHNNLGLKFHRMKVLFWKISDMKWWCKEIAT